MYFCATMNVKNKKIKVGISVGDTNGIGIEIILKSLAQKEILEFFTPIIFGSTKLLSYQKNFYNLNNLYFQGIFNCNEAIDGKINVLNLWKDNVNIQFGKPTEESGKLAFSSLQAATKALKNNEIDVLVTAPIHKENIQSDEFNFVGHTEYLAEELQGNPLMFLVSSQLKVALVTQHIPIKKITETITQEKVLEKIKQVNQSLQKDFLVKNPKIAVLALNPHCGDNGLIGTEEQEMIHPAIELAKKEGILAFGTYAADAFFKPDNYQNFDAVLAMYHDQGLIPFKSLLFDEGVNFTANLSYVRTSPDHGTAYDIAGKNQADANSFKEAIFTAIEIYKNREIYQEITSNILQKANLKDADFDEDLPLE